MSDEISLSIEETNQLRKKLGLKPLQKTSSSSEGSSSSSSKKKNKKQKSNENHNNNNNNNNNNNKNNNNEKDKGEISLSVDETNELRKKLGLKPLNDAKPSRPSSGKISADSSSNNSTNDSTDLAKKVLAARQKRQQKQGLVGKSLAELLGEEDAATWVTKSRKIEQTEKRNAEKNAARLRESDELGAGYSAKDLSGLKVKHSLKELGQVADESVILTLKDTFVLNEDRNDINSDEDELENIHLTEAHLRQDRLKMKKKIKLGYDNLEAAEEEKELLYQYADDQEKKAEERRHGFVLHGDDIDVEKEMRANQIKDRLAQHFSVQEVNLDLPQVQASDYFTKEEMEVIQPKKKKKKRSRRREAVSVIEKLGNTDLDLDEEDLSNNLHHQNNNTHDKSTSKLLLEDDDNMAAPDDRGSRTDSAVVRRKLQKQAQDELRKLRNYEGALGKSALESQQLFRSEYEQDSELLKTAALKKNAQQPAASFSLVDTLKKVKQMEEQAGPTVTLGDTVFEPASTVAASDEDEEDDSALRITTTSEFLRGIDASGSHTRQRSIAGKSSNDEDDNDPMAFEEPQAEDEDAQNSALGVSGVLHLVETRGEDKQPLDEMWIGRRNDERPTWMGTKDDPAPNIKLTYTDENGRRLTPKEAFRYQSRVFHGKQPSKKQQEKYRLRNIADLELLKKKSASAQLLSQSVMMEQQEKTQQPYVVLSGLGRTESAASGERMLRKDTGASGANSKAVSGAKGPTGGASAYGAASGPSVVSQLEFKGFELKTSKKKTK